MTCSGASYGITPETGYSVTIGANASVTVSGSTKAINGTVKNAAAGYGWTDKAGTTGKADIAISSEGQTLNYLKVQFPVIIVHI